MEQIKELIKKCLTFIKGAAETVKGWIAKVDWLNSIYETLKGAWEPFAHIIPFLYVVLIAAVLVVVLIIMLICCLISHGKKRKVQFFVDGELYATTITKLGKKIVLPEAPSKEGFEFVGWFDKKLKKQAKVKLNKKKLCLYAKFVEVVAEEAPVEELPVEPVVEVEAVEEDVSVKSLVDFGLNDEGATGLVEESIELEEIVTLGSLYDDIRYEILCYERAETFKKMGVVRKQIIAEMFEKDEQINLYLAADPALMMLKGYNVEAYTQQEFEIVPCKKVIKTQQDAEEAKALIAEVMTLNHLVKSDVICAKKNVSDELTRKKGFAFSVKNDVVVTSSADYYNMLRAIVLSYSESKVRKFADDVEDKMILKIFKKEENIYLYLAFDAEKEGLEFVGYDKNFAETPAMFEVSTAEDCLKANELIDKLMYVYGMDKNPMQAELTLDEVEANCGFGYRVRR